MLGESNEVPERIGFFLVPNFSLICFSSAVEPLRSANRLSGRTLYHWELISASGTSVMASGGISLEPAREIADVQHMPTVAVCGGMGTHAFDDKRVLNWLRRLARQGANIGAISTGSHVLARAGLLDDYRCTVHWEDLAAFRESYPELDVSDEIFEIDRSRFTCSGGTASMDMMLHVISMQHGYDLAAAVAEQFMHERIRDRHDHQRMNLRARLGVAHPKLLAVVSRMEETLEMPLSRAELAHGVGLSTRQLERLFRKYLYRTPTRFYLELRLERARLLLRQTTMSVLDVALACGFVSASHFSKCYREHFQRRPGEERRHHTETGTPGELAH
ncbi:MAG: GlxA family transcriptional regulator [Minwuiales bacterium]|nr:GlxA family transcriptional regulator [Minwuiales bacterium]